MHFRTRLSCHARSRRGVAVAAAATMACGLGYLSLPNADAASLSSATPAVGASPTASTVTVSSSSALQSAIKSAQPGTTILINAGTYTGPFYPSVSGTAAAPIVMKPAGNGTVLLTANLPMPSCGASGPDLNRTIRFKQGASYWTIQGLSIKGGVYIAGSGVQQVHNWMENYIESGNWQALRAVPGRGVNDPNAARNAVSYVASKLNMTLSPIDGVQLLNDTITQKGVHVTLARYGTISNTSISNIACGVGPGIWFGSYSDGWTVSNNNISNIAESTHQHYMQEGIRVDDGSNYNTIQNNTVTNLPGDGRAFTTDQTASYNTFKNNTASSVAIGFNEEMSGWGNVWADNTVTGYREVGFAFRLMDAPLSAPSKNSSTYDGVVRCNTASGTGPALQMGAAVNTSVTGNVFHSITLGDHLKSYWVAQGDTWNGAHVVPPSTVSNPTLSSC
jgi:Right handed beta helix region